MISSIISGGDINKIGPDINNIPKKEERYSINDFKNSIITHSKLFKNLLLYLMIIFTINMLIFIVDGDAFNNNKDVSFVQKIIDCFYFSTTTMSTIGYGDITPQKWYSRMAVSLEQLMVIAILYNTLQIEQEKQSHDLQDALLLTETEKENVRGILDAMNKRKDVITTRDRRHSLAIVREKSKWNTVKNRLTEIVPSV